MRRIGRLRSEASPSKVAVMPCPPTTPIISREPVPALPKSSTPSGASRPPTPTPSHPPAALARPRDGGAERAAGLRRAQHVARPPAGPRSRVSPTASRPRISARCEIDLSPGTRTRPVRPALRRAVSGVGAVERGQGQCSGRDRRRRLAWKPVATKPWREGRARLVLDRAALICSRQQPRFFDEGFEPWPDPNSARSASARRPDANSTISTSRRSSRPIRASGAGRRAAPSRGRAEPAVARPAPEAEEAETETTEDAELISLEEAEDEAAGAKGTAERGRCRDRGRRHRRPTTPSSRRTRTRDDDVTDLIGDGIEDDEEP